MLRTNAAGKYVQQVQHMYSLDNVAVGRYIVVTSYKNIFLKKFNKRIVWFIAYELF